MKDIQEMAKDELKKMMTNEQGTLKMVRTLDPTRHRDELIQIPRRLAEITEKMNALADMLHDIALAEGWRETAGRALSAPYLSLNEFADIVQAIKSGIPHDINLR